MERCYGKAVTTFTHKHVCLRLGLRPSFIGGSRVRNPPRMTFANITYVCRLNLQTRYLHGLDVFRYIRVSTVWLAPMHVHWDQSRHEQTRTTGCSSEGWEWEEGWTSVKTITIVQRPFHRLHRRVTSIIGVLRVYNKHNCCWTVFCSNRFRKMS